MERRLLLVFALTFLVIIAFQPLLRKYLPQAPPPPAKTETQAPGQPGAGTNTPAPVAVQKAAPQSVATKQATSESETVIENDLYRITFTNRGGQVKSWVLKKYDDEQRRPLELINRSASEKYGYPLSLWTYDETQRNKLNSALYVGSQSGTLQAPADIVFEYADQDLVVRKRFSFDHTYVVRVESSVQVKGTEIPAFPMWPAGFGDETGAASYHSSRIEYQYNNNTERLDIKKISGGNTI
jgi:YidC/Oxa1 family membrane protein insertase